MLVRLELEKSKQISYSVFCLLSSEVFGCLSLWRAAMQHKTMFEEKLSAEWPPAEITGVSRRPIPDWIHFCFVHALSMEQQPCTKSDRYE
jgi:hypothetical protein